MAKKIFEVEISNRGPRGYETAALLKMPATWGEFNDALQKARIEDGRCCQNELTRIEYPGIQREMIGDNVDLYELNLLAQRLSELSKDDQMGMDGLLQIEKIHSTGPISLPRLINLTFNADICLLAPQVSNTQELGALLYEGEMLSDEAMALLDTTEPDSQFQNALLGVFGQKHQEDFDGVFTSQGYVEPGDEFKEVYRRGEIAPYFDHSGAPVVLEVSKGYFDDPGYDGKTSSDESYGLIERQADALATALLMPIPQVKKCFYRLRPGKSKECLVTEMARIFQVSKQAMRIRLEAHNLL